MKQIIIAVLLSLLGPGLGQLYNKDYKKGIGLILVSTLLFFVPLFWLVSKVAPLLPDPKKEAVSQEMVQSLILQTVKGDVHTLNLITFAFFGIWAYAITQAYFKAKEINEKKSLQESERVDPPDTTAE